MQITNFDKFYSLVHVIIALLFWLFSILDPDLQEFYYDGLLVLPFTLVGCFLLARMFSDKP